MSFTVTELSLLVLVGLTAAIYVKTEVAASSLLAAVVGVLTAVVVALLATH